MDRKTNVLRVQGLHWEDKPSADEEAAADAALADLARWLGADSISRDA
jgi:uncharacterized protein YcaQ